LSQIETSRWTLRDLQMGDAALIRKMANVDPIRRYQGALRLESGEAIVEFVRAAIFQTIGGPAVSRKAISRSSMCILRRGQKTVSL